MKNIILYITIFTAGFSVFAQQDNLALEADQNPNYEISQNKYTDSIQKSHTLLQGTTLQDTYRAIDPLEEKRELKSLRRQHRAQRPYWRHQRRLERIRNTQYFENNTWGWGNNLNNNFYSGFNNFHNRRFNNFYKRGFNTRHRRNIRNYSFGYNALSLGVLAACLF